MEPAGRTTVIFCLAELALRPVLLLGVAQLLFDVPQLPIARRQGSSYVRGVVLGVMLGKLLGMLPPVLARRPRLGWRMCWCLDWFRVGKMSSTPKTLGVIQLL
jgi:hypothetical protein